MPTYTINFLNNSDSTGNFCIFQQKPNGPNEESFALAWLVKPAIPNTKVPISWNTDLYFFWAKTGELKPGVIFNAGDALRTNLTENNAVTLIKQDHNYKFTDQKTWHQKGILNISTDDTTAFNQASIGVGMSGSATIAAQAQTSRNFSFSLSFKYWITFSDVQQGQVLDQSDIPDAVQIIFPDGIFSMNATLNQDNTWTVTQGMD